jgi:hypothetical protein
MNTLTKLASHKAAVGTTAFLALTTLGSGLSHADSIPADPTGGYMGTAQTYVQSWVLTVGVPVLFGLTLLGIGLRLARRWMRKAGGAV